METQIKTEVGTKDLGVAVIDLTMVLLGRIWTLVGTFGIVDESHTSRRMKTVVLTVV